MLVYRFSSNLLRLELDSMIFDIYFDIGLLDLGRGSGSLLWTRATILFEMPELLAENVSMW